MAKYRCSNGDYVTKEFIDRKVREAKEKKLQAQIDEYGYNFSEVSGHNGSGTRLDNAHIKSVDWCQKNGCTELAWDVNNIMIMTREEHQRYDRNDVQLNFKK